jgi:hypothetical protein
MRRFAVPFALAVLLLTAGSPRAANTMKATAPDKMMPLGQGEKMRECNKKSLDPSIKMEDRAAFVKKCTGMT